MEDDLYFVLANIRSWFLACNFNFSQLYELWKMTEIVLKLMMSSIICVLLQNTCVFRRRHPSLFLKKMQSKIKKIKTNIKYKNKINQSNEKQCNKTVNGCGTAPGNLNNAVKRYRHCFFRLIKLGHFAFIWSWLHKVILKRFYRWLLKICHEFNN